MEIEYKHINWHQKHLDNLSRGDRIADAVAGWMGSWAFIIIQTMILTIWVIVNTAALIDLVRVIPMAHGAQDLLDKWLLALQFDKYPFIFMNLFMSTEAAYATPLILMSQNRAALRDKLQAEHEYEHQEQALEFNTKLTSDIHKFLAASSEEKASDTADIDQAADSKVEEILRLLRAMEAREAARSGRTSK